jgi:hypothetical protein
MYLFLIVVFSLLHFPQVVRFVLEPPLRELYFAGPRLKGYGFWNGLPPADICAHLTQTSADVWRQYNSVQCDLVLDQYFHAFYVGAYSLLYVWMLYYTLSYFQQVYVIHHQYRLLSSINNRIKNE